MRMLNKKIAAATAGTALALAASGVAFAYWTNSGSGVGSATTTDNDAIVINQATPVAGLYPGGPAQPISGTFTNDNPSPVFVEQVSIAVASTFNAQADDTKPACTAADFAIVQPTVTHAEVVTGTTWGGASIKLLNLPTNQDNCKNVTPALTLTSN